MALVQSLFAGHDISTVEPVIYGGAFLLVGHFSRDFRQVGGCDDGFHSRQRQCPAGVDASDTGMGVGTTQYLAVQHPGQVYIGGVTGAAHHFVGTVMPDRTSTYDAILLG